MSGSLERGLACKLLSVQRLHAAYPVNYIFYLISLQLSNNLYVKSLIKAVNFVHKLLNAVFTDGKYTVIRKQIYLLRRSRFSYGNDFHLIASVRLFQRLFYPLFYPSDILRQLLRCYHPLTVLFQIPAL